MSDIVIDLNHPLPCPFCGGPPKYNRGADSVWCDCPECPWSKYPYAWHAIGLDEWNRRGVDYKAIARACARLKSFDTNHDFAIRECCDSIDTALYGFRQPIAGAKCGACGKDWKFGHECKSHFSQLGGPDSDSALALVNWVMLSLPGATREQDAAFKNALSRASNMIRELIDERNTLSVRAKSAERNQ